MASSKEYNTCLGVEPGRLYIQEHGSHENLYISMLGANGTKILPLGVHILPFKLAGLIGVEVALRTSRAFVAINTIIDPAIFILGKSQQVKTETGKT